MLGAVQNTQQSRRRAAKATRWLTAACEPLEHRRLLSGYGPLVSVGSFIPFPNGENPRSALTLDTNGNLWGTTSGGGPNGYGTVFEIAKGSSTIATVASFNGSNGKEPIGGVTFDTSGNLWGTTNLGGASNNGTVFEITAGSSTITTVASFSYSTTGSQPFAGVTFDASGNLWGTNAGGGVNRSGTVFEIAKGSSTISTVFSFNGSNGSLPQASVTFDARGNLWGTTFAGGAYSDGTVFEISKGSSSITNIANFNGSNGGNPASAVTFDSSGNLWGTAPNGGASSDGTVFKIANGSSTITTVASFNLTNGSYPQAAVTFDSSGNLWGTAPGGGANSDGTIFEIAKGSSTITRVASFNGTNGASPQTGVIFDSNGNLWSTTQAGGAGNLGAVYEVVKGSSTITDVGSFSAISGADPQSAVTFDARGNLWGTTYGGGVNGDGTIFEIAKGTGNITTVVNFNGSNGNGPQAAVTFDTSGNLWGSTAYGGTSGVGTVFEIANGSSAITTVASFNGSNGQVPSAITLDASGNLWGSTYNSSVGSLGTVFEIVKGSGTITTIASFNGSNGESPSAVTFDASGNLWGTTLYSSSTGEGTVFEIVKGSNTISTIASFDGNEGQGQGQTGSPTAVQFDSAGNLWGTTAQGGTNLALDGTVFEIVKGSNKITTVATFDGSNGDGNGPLAPVTFDSAGNLWGTTSQGGAFGLGSVFEIAKGTSTIKIVASFNNAQSYQSAAAVTFDASGNVWGTTPAGGAAYSGSVWELSLTPAWLSDPAGNDTWNTAAHILTVNDPTSITADPGSDQPIIEANGSSAVLTINPSSTLQIHLNGLSLTNGASAVVTSLGAARTATNHRVLVLGLAGAASAPLFAIDSTSKLDLTDNDLVDHDGSLPGVTSLLASGFTSGWTGNGIVSSKASGSTIHTLGVGQPASAGTFDSETVGTSDVEIRYTYYGDANLDGHVDGGDYSKIDSGVLTHSTGWSHGDFNYDGVLNGSDYTLIDNAFNTQGASLAAIIASPMASTSAEVTLSSLNRMSAPVFDRAFVRFDIGKKAIMGSRIASFAPDLFSTKMPIEFTESMEQSIEVSSQKRDLLDELALLAQ